MQLRLQGKNDAVPAPTTLAAAPVLPYHIASQTNVIIRVGATFSTDFCMIKMVKNVSGKSENCYSL
jgi:hypothetical protein